MSAYVALHKDESIVAMETNLIIINIEILTFWL